MSTLPAALRYTEDTMIRLLTGNNTFEIQQELDHILAEFDAAAERVDGSELDTKRLPDLLTGTTLFSEKRLVIIKNLSENKKIWTDFTDWLPRISDDITLILVDNKPDKRTITYKELKKYAQVSEYEAWTERDTPKAQKWVKEQAEMMKIDLNTKSVQYLIKRVGIDQWLLFLAIEKLALVGTVTEQVIDEVIEANPIENVFNLFDAAIRGEAKLVSTMLKTLELSEDPYRLFGLLSTQAFQLAVLAVAGEGDSVAKDLGVSPYGLSKLTQVARRLGRSGARRVVRTFAEADDDMKLSRAEPWLLIERALLQLALK